MRDVDTSKRTLSTPFSSVKRAKTEHHDPEPFAYRTPPPLPLTALHGVERIRLPPSLNVRRLSSQSLHQLANERTEILRRQGRRVVGLPVVLDDGIVLNWIRHSQSSVRGDHDTSSNVHQTVTSPVVQGDKFRLLPVSTGMNATEVITIDSEEDTLDILSSQSPVQRKLPDAINYSDSDVDSVPPIRLESRAKGCQMASSHRALSARELDSSPGRPSTRGEVAVAPLEPQSADANVTISSLETDGTDEEVTKTEVINASKMSALHAEPPPLPSLQSIGGLRARRKQRGHLTRDVLPNGPMIAPRVSQKQGRNELLEETFAITSSESDEELDVQTSDPQLKRVPLPKTQYGRPRRLLMPASADLPLVAVTMRGDCHFIERKEKYRITGHSLPNPGIFRHVADACMVGDTAVLGCDSKGTDQIAFLSAAGKPQMINVTCSPHSSGPRYQDTQRRGVSCLAAIHAEGGHIKFLSGGYDGTIYEWMAENLHEPRYKKAVSHGACIMALAYRDRDRSVVASAQKKLHVTDLNRCKTVVHPFSNDIQQIHIHPQAAYVTLLEVRHLDHQIQLYDSRKANFDSEPCLSFGYRSSNNKFPTIHTRGSVHLVHFAKANEDGCVSLWDFRNVKGPAVEKRFRQAEKVVHTIFADMDIATFGDNVVTFFEDYLAQ